MPFSTRRLWLQPHTRARFLESAPHTGWRKKLLGRIPAHVALLDHQGTPIRFGFALSPEEQERLAARLNDYLDTLRTASSEEGSAVQQPTEMPYSVTDGTAETETDLVRQVSHSD